MKILMNLKDADPHPADLHVERPFFKSRNEQGFKANMILRNSLYQDWLQNG